jgi:hypothetical protein
MAWRWYLAKPRNAQTTRTDRGNSQSSTAWIFCSSIVTPTAEMTCPRYTTKRSPNEHLERLPNK